MSLIVPTLIANAYLVGERARWVLVDACTPGQERRILRAAEHRFGRGARPRAILLTHGHFDHAGSAGALAGRWGVPIYAHSLELPYLTGQSLYPPFDFSSPGFFTRIASFFPTATVDLGTRVAAFARRCARSRSARLGDGLRRPATPPATWHSSARADAVLLAGDAVTTMNLDSFAATVTRRRQVCRPPVPATSNWKDAEKIRASAGRPAPLA